MIAFGVGGVLLTAQIMTALSTAQRPWVVFARAMTALIIVSGYASINAVVKADLFPDHIRTLCGALPYAIANAAFDGTAVGKAQWFKDLCMESDFY